MSFTKSCTCPPMPGMPCTINANGTLVPPDPGMGAQDLEPTTKLPWKVLDSSGHVVCQGEANVSGGLTWSINCTDAAVMSGQSYTIQILPVWVTRTPLPDSESVTC